MQQLIFMFHVLAAIALIALILLQHGKGADAGAAFGSGASQTMFGSVGSMPFLTKITASLAMIFFATSLILGYVDAHQAKQQESILPAPTELMKQPVSDISKTAPIPAVNVPVANPDMPVKKHNRENTDNE
jgi:preprotein translocase subunit SecG